nr:DUF4129 domain-containing protein [Armatimonadota bacterium]
IHTLLFLLVPCLALLIAGAVGSVDDLITGCALTFCIASLFSLLYHASLRPAEGSERPVVPFRLSLLNAVTLACLTFMLTAALALAASIPLQMGGARIRPFVMGTVLPMVRSRRGAGGTRTPVGTATAFNSVKVGQGPLQLSHEPVLRLRSSERHSLRSRVYTEYNRTGWIDHDEARSPTARRRAQRYSLTPDDYSASWPVVRQEVVLLTPGSTLPAYSRVAAFQMISGRPVLRFDSHGCIRLLRSNPTALTYAVESHVPPGLNGLTDGPYGPAPPPTSPPLVPGEVKFLAANLKGHTDVETTRNVVRYLQANCTYDLNAPAVPADRDAVDFFLFGSRAGYCDLFATSAALLLQLDGVPARYCTGYLPGEWDAAQQAIVVTAAQAHAWIEVFIQGRGWITADPTPPGFTGPPSAPTAFRSLLEKLHLEQLSLSYPTILSVLALALTAMLLYQGLPAVRRKRVGERLGVNGPPAAVIMNYWSMGEALRKAGLPRAGHETPLEYAARIGATHLPSDIKESVASLTAAFVAHRYGNQPSSDDHAATLASLRQALKRKDAKRAMKR